MLAVRSASEGDVAGALECCFFGRLKRKWVERGFFCFFRVHSSLEDQLSLRFLLYDGGVSFLIIIYQDDWGWLGRKTRRMLFVERIRAGYRPIAQQYAARTIKKRVQRWIVPPVSQPSTSSTFITPTRSFVFLYSFRFYWISKQPHYHHQRKVCPPFLFVRPRGINERSREINEMKLWGTLLRWKFKFE